MIDKASEEGGLVEIGLRDRENEDRASESGEWPTREKAGGKGQREDEA